MGSLEFTVQGEQAIFTGDLTRKTVTKGVERKSARLVGGSALTLNFENVAKVDTAGLAWLLVLVEKAEKNNCQLSLKGVPSGLVKLAKLSAADSFLPL